MLFIRSNSGDHELLYWNGETGDQKTEAGEDDWRGADVDWASQSCTVTFQTLG